MSNEVGGQITELGRELIGKTIKIQEFNRDLDDFGANIYNDKNRTTYTIRSLQGNACVCVDDKGKTKVISMTEIYEYFASHSYDLL